MDYKKWYFGIIISAIYISLVPQIVYPIDVDTAASEKISQIEGVYKRSDYIEVVGEKERREVEDIVEVVRFDDENIYIRVKLIFTNGHSCGIYGIASYDKGSFVYRRKEKSDDGYPSCTLTVSTKGKDLFITDRISPDGVATCRGYCGLRGSLSDYPIDMWTSPDSLDKC